MVTSRRALIALFSGLAFLVLWSGSSIAATHCGYERWDVKVARDRDALKINVAPTPTSIADLVAIQAPAHPNRRSKSRYAPAELTVYQVEATIKVVKPERDRDYHIVIADAAGDTMIVEAPNPSCAAGSRFFAQIKAVRAAINRHFGGAIRRKLHPDIKAKITGVAFFDVLHGQDGVAPNGIELHPILAITFE